MKTKNSTDTIENLESKEFSTFFKMLLKKYEGSVSIRSFWDYLEGQGIQKDDPRMLKVKADLKKYAREHGIKDKEISSALFDDLVKNNNVLRKCCSRSMIVPEFEDFCQELEEIFEETKKNTGGKVANYIPQLGRVDPEQFAVSVCTIDGQTYSMGDADKMFCLQSSCKPINYCLAIEEHGVEKVHQHIGREPSGHSFNELSLNKAKLPHNPMINAGAIMSLSLFKADEALSERFDHVIDTWTELCGGRRPGFNNSVYQSERQTADRNFALAYFMREHKAFPEDTDLIETLEFYFQCCSIESSASNLSIAAATLANAGQNPQSGKRVFGETTVQHCLSLMLSCGMYDFSGEFAFSVGLPAKSGVSGVILLVIPNVMGICIWSPRLDALGNSVRGIEFCERLVERYNFHHYDSLRKDSHKKNPRLKKYESKVSKVMRLIWSASNGDIDELIRLHAEGVDLGLADYDGRTALHLAASENQVEALKYLISQDVGLEPVDRWGGTPLTDAQREGYDGVAKLLKEALREKRPKPSGQANAIKEEE